MKRLALLLALLLALSLASTHGSDAKLLRLMGTSTGGTPFTPAGAPVLVTAPTISPAPNNTQSASLGNFIGNSVTASTGTWNNCSGGCTYRYQWFYNDGHFAGVTSESQTGAFTIPNVSFGGPYFFPVESTNPPAVVYSTVTATNSSGSTTASTPITNPTTNYYDQVGGGTVLNCTDIFSATANSVSAGTMTLAAPSTGFAVGQSVSAITGWVSGLNPGVTITAGSGLSWTISDTAIAISSPTTVTSTACATTRAVDNTLAVGDWLTFSGETVIFNAGDGGGISSYSWAADNTGLPAQSHIGQQTAAGKPFQITSNLSGYNLEGSIRYHTSAGNTGGNFGPTFPVGPALVSNSAGQTIAAPVNTSVPAIFESPAQPTSSPNLIPYVGFTLLSNGNGLPGNWNNVPWNVTTQWMFCSTVANSGIPASTCTGTTPGAGTGATLTGSVIAGATQVPYVLTDADIGKIFFTRVTAHNTGGTTVQDSSPTLATRLPLPATVLTSPAVQGYPVVGNVGAGNGGAVVLASPGTVTGGPLSSFSTLWYSCPSGSPTCMTLATGVQSATQYAIDPTTDVVGNTLRIILSAENSSGTPFVAPSTPVTIATLSSTPLPAGPLGVYPAGRDPLAAFNCAPLPTSYAHNWYVDNQKGAGGNGMSAATAFNTFALAKTASAPGDRILLEGTAAWNSTAGQVGNYGGTISIAGVNTTAGATNFITIQADAATGAHPMATGFQRTAFGNGPDQGWILDGIWLNVQASLQFDGLRDFVFTNGRMGYYPDITTALADYTANCITTSCSYNSATQWFNGGPGLASHLSSTPILRGGAVCQAWTNNAIQFVFGGIVTGHGATDLLIEGNDMGFFTSDSFDISGEFPVIYHSNLIHNPFATSAHPDAFQLQQLGGTIAFYGLEIDSNKVIRFTPDATPMLTFVDTNWCTLNGVSPCNATTSQFLGGDESCLQYNGGFGVGFRFVNNLCSSSEQWALEQNTLATVANNTFMGSTFLEDTSNNDYYANNALDSLGCFRSVNNGTTVFTNNVILNNGPAPGSLCPAGAAVVDTSGIDPFTDAYPPNIGGGATTNTLASTFNGIPPGPSPGPASSLYRTGVAGFGAPTVTINGTTSTSPPNIGAY